MNNQEIAAKLRLLGILCQFDKEVKFKVIAYSNRLLTVA